MLQSENCSISALSNFLPGSCLSVESRDAVVAMEISELESSVSSLCRRYIFMVPFFLHSRVTFRLSSVTAAHKLFDSKSRHTQRVDTVTGNGANATGLWSLFEPPLPTP